MKRASRRFVALVLTSAFAVLIASGVCAGKEATITGIVYAADWDDDGKVISVVIAAADGEYLVMGQGAGLLKEEGKTVKATGTISVDEEGLKTISIKSYKLVTPEAEVEEDVEMRWEE